jgi:hypothetical protein
MAKVDPLVFYGLAYLAFAVAGALAFTFIW